MKPVIADTLTELTLPEFDIAGVHLKVEPDALDITPDGIRISLMGDVQSSDSTNPCAASLPSQPISESPVPPPIPNIGPSLVSVSISEPFIQRGVYAAWRAGWMCFDSDTYGYDLGELLSPLC